MHITIARTGTLVFILLLTVTMLTAERTTAAAATAPAGADRRAAPSIPAELRADTLAAPTRSAPDAASQEAAPNAQTVAEAPTPAAPAEVAVLGQETAPAAAEPAPEPMVPPAAAPTAPQPAAAEGAVILASWYGPGFYGNRTACGQIYSPQILGVAHKTLPCGTPLVLSYGGRTVSVPVIDRGPYIVGRTLDLSAATKVVLGCSDLCTLTMQFAR